MNQATPRLIITDPLGHRVVPINKPLVTLGRRTESDVRVTGVDVSRHHADIAADNGTCRLRDLDSKWGLVSEDGHLEFRLGRGEGRVTLPGRIFDTSRKIPEAVFATGNLRIVADLMDGSTAAQHLGTVALGIRHVLCAPLRPVRYVEKADEHAEDQIAACCIWTAARRPRCVRTLRALRSRRSRRRQRGAQPSGRGVH